MKKYFLLILCFAFLVACSPQKRLNRLIKNHPELAETDTVYSTKTFTVPGLNIDTNFAASTNVNGIDELVNHYNDYLDSIRRIKLSNEIKTYIINRKCLEDTFKIILRDGGFVKFWQTNGFFFYQLNQPNKKIQFTVPSITNKFDVETKYSWLMFWVGFSVIPLIITILVIIKKIYFP